MTNFLVYGREACHFEVVGVADLHKPLGFVGFGDPGENGCNRFLTRTHDALYALADGSENHACNGSHNAGNERELPVLPEEDAEERYDLKRIADQNNRCRNGTAERNVGFIHELRAHETSRICEISGEGESQDIGEEFHAKRYQHRLTNLRKHVGAHYGRNCVQKRHADKRRRGRHNDPGLLLIKARVRELAEERCGERRHRRCAYHVDARKHHLSLIGQGVLEKALQNRIKAQPGREIE